MCLTPWHPPKTATATTPSTAEEIPQGGPVLVAVGGSETSSKEIEETVIRPPGLFRIEL